MASILDEIHQTFGQSDNGGAPSPGGAGARPRSVEEFAAEVAPAAEAVGRRIGVDPAVLIGQWGLETGWGKSVIPGTNNLGNIKDFSGRGVEATDNMTGSRDGYRAYADYNAFGDDYASLLERRYKDALGSGGDAARFGAALKAGGYAEDPAYVEKLASAADMVRGVSPRQTGGESANYTASNRDVLVDSSNMMEARRRQSASDASPISTSLGRGWEQMTDAVGNYVDLLAGDEEAIVDRLQNWQKYDAENPMPSASQRFMADWTDENYVGAMMNPAGLFGGMTEQLANSIPAMAGSIPGMLIGGAYGAGFGPLGVLVGAAAGGAAGSAPGSVAIETGARLPAMMAADGVDVSSPQAVSAWLNQNRDKVIEEGAKKGLTVAAFDGVMGGMGSAIVMKPAARFAQAESRIFAGMGVQAGDKAAMEAARKTPQYAAAIKPFAAELEVASSAANNAMRAFASFAAETAGEIGGEYYGEVAATGEGNWNEALLEGVMAGGQSAVTTGAQFVGGKMMAAAKPNSPLSNAANIATEAAASVQSAAQDQAAQDQAVADQAQAGVVPDDVQAQEVSEFDQRLAVAQSFVEDKTFLQALRGTEGFGKESVTELLSAYAKARNPNVDAMVRERALADIERFVETFNSRPNFTMPGAAPESAGTDIVPAGRSEVGPVRRQAPQDDGRTIDGEVVERPAQIEGEATRALPTEEALQAKRQADADYDQAYQDLVKAEQLGASDAELLQYRQALEEAKAQQEALSAQLEDVAQRVEGAQQQASAERRRALLNDILDDPNTVNASARFAAEMRRHGYQDATPTAEELAVIKRFEDARAALAEQSNVEPSAPNQMPAAVVPERAEQAAPVSQKTPAEKVAEVKALVRAGWRPVNGRKLVSPSGKVRNLNPLEFAAAKEEYRKLKAGEEGTGSVVHPDGVSTEREQAAKPNTEDGAENAQTEGDGVDSQQESVAPTNSLSRTASWVIRNKETGDVVAETFDRKKVDSLNAQKYDAIPIQEHLASLNRTPPTAEIRSDLDAAAHEAATSPLNDRPHPSDEQKSAGNYKVGKIRLHGMDISIENPRGSVRSGVAPDGTRWENRLAHHYGYIRGSEGRDGDHLDVFLTDGAEDAKTAWVIDQKNADGSFDEHKIVIGPTTEQEARDAYLANYDEGWDGIGAITSMPMEAFKAWALDGKKKRKPLAYVEPAIIESEIKEDNSSAPDEDVSERVAEEAPAAHIENGEAEPATQSVVSESIQKSADNTPRDLKEAKRFLMSKIDAAIQSAPVKQKNGDGGFVVFDVPGDGRFKVVNTKERLAEFKKRVNASAGFSEKSARPDSVGGRFNPEVSDSSRTGVREMLDDGDLLASVEYAEALGKPMAFSVARRGEAKPAAYYDTESYERDGITAIIGREWTKAQSWAAIDPASGTVIAQGKNKAEVTKRLKDTLADRGVADRLKQELAAKTALPQSALSAQWLEWAEAEQDRLDGDRAKKAERERRTYSSPTSQTDSEGWGRRVADGGMSVHTKRVDLEDGESAVAILREVGGQNYSGEILVRGSTTERFGHGFGRSMSLPEAKEYAEAALSDAKTSGVDYKGFERKPIGNGAFELRDGNMTVRVEPQGDGKYQASFRGAKSSPHLQGEQGAVDWADAYRGEAERAKEKERGDVSTVAGQKRLAERGSRIASLKAMNAQLRGIDPSAAWLDSNIESAEDLDAMQDSISQALVNAQRKGETKGDDGGLRKRLEAASSDDLKAVFGAMSLAGSRMTHAERVEALLTEDAGEVAAALDGVYSDKPATVGPAAEATPVVLHGERRDPERVSAFNPYMAGDVVTIAGKRWQIQQDMGGWYLTDTGNWRGTHPTIQRIKAMNDLIREVEQASRDGQESAQDAAESQPEQGVETDISADKSADEAAVKESLTAQSDAISPDAATKQMEWRDGGQRDGERRHTLIFKESAGDINGITVATLRKYGKGKWVLDDADMDGDIESFDGLREAKKAGVARALKYLEREGYVAQAEASKTEAPAAKPAEPVAEGKIEDAGEKIGGARKDTAQPTGPRPSRGEKRSDVPGWKNRYAAVESMIDPSAENKKWSLFDKRTKKPMRMGWKVVEFDSEQAANDAIPLFEVARNHRAVAVQDGKFAIMRDVSDRKRVRVVEQDFDSRDDALAYMNANAEEIIETRTSFGEEILPKPDNAMREGVARRDGDAKADDFINDFGLRAVEFGNWNNQEERQEVMNHAYDALSDLAEVLNIPARAIGFDGELGLAFGARGQGLSGARAHYEPAYAAINLTKMSGAGSLAHEWFHALDHYFGRQDGKTPSVRQQDGRGDMTFAAGDAENSMVSHGFTRSGSGVREELRAAYDVLIKTMFQKAEKFVEDTQQAEKFVGVAKKALADELQKIRNNLAAQLDARYYKRNNKPASAEQLAEFDAIAESMIAGESLETAWRSIEGGRARYGTFRWTNDSLEKLGEIYKAVRGRSGFSAERSGVLDGLRQDMNLYSQRLKMLADAQSGDEKTRGVPTEFAMEAKSIDQGRASNYWTTPHEMAARAFQSYVEDKVSESGGKSEFLTYGTNMVVPTPWGWKRPFPTGEERVAINKAFDKFVGALKTRETDKGVALFRLDSDDDVARVGVSRVEADALVREFVAKFPGAPKIEVVDSFDQLPISVQADARSQGAQPGSTKGAYLHSRGSAFVVVENHSNLADVEATLFHEVLGHAGTRKLFGDKFMTEQNKLFMALGGIDGLARIMSRRGLDGEFDRYVQGLLDARAKNPARWTENKIRFILSEEVFAHVAEQQKSRPGLRDRFMALVGMIRDWLRKTGLVKLADLGESDLLFMLNRARDVLRVGDTSVVRNGVKVAHGQIRDAEGNLVADENDAEYSALRTAAEVLGLVERQSEATVFRIDDDANTIDVDGVERPRLNSEGRPIHPTDEGIRNFWRWFGSSQVVDADGKPLVVYHGTTNVAEIQREGFKRGWTNLTDSRVVADSYQEWERGDTPGTLSLYVKAVNPARYDAKGEKYTNIGNKVFGATYDAERAGNDAIIIKDVRDNYDSSVPTDPHMTVVVFNPEQIKSAAGNRGAFAPSDANIMRQRIDNSNIRNAVFTALAKFDDSFQQPRATQKTLDAIAKEIDPGFRIVEKPKGFANLKTKGRAVKAWEVFPRGQEVRSGYIYEDARGRVWIDVSRLQEGVDQGNKIYGIVAGYAHNNGKVLIGDPAGLSEAGFFRRLENMISSALKYGTTDHIYPHAAQLDPEGYYEAEGEPEKAKRLKGLGLDWKDGDFSHNLTKMLEVSYNASVRFAPEIKDIIYDFNSRQFVDANTGDRRSKRDFEDLSRRVRAREGKGNRGGSTTYARAAIYNTLVREGSREGRRNLLAQISDQLSGRGLDFELRKLFYQRTDGETSAGLTAESFRSALVERFGEDGVSRLEDLGLLNVVSPEGQDKSSPAWYDPAEQKAYFVPEFMADEKAAVGAVLHEIGEHHGLESFLGPRAWRTLKARIAGLAREGGNDIRAAWDGVLDNYPEFAGMSRAEMIDSDRFMHEVIAKVGESAAGRKTGLWRDILAAVNRFLLKMGLGRQINKNELADLVAGSLARVMRGEGGGGPGGGRMDARRIIQSASRTVNDFVVPDTPEFAGNTSGDLGYIDGKPIRVAAGQHFDAHRGFGMAKIAGEADVNPRREPPSYTADRAENIVRHIVAVANSSDAMFEESGKIILRASRMNEAIVLQDRGGHYSVISLRPAPKVVWGAPVRTGRGLVQSLSQRSAIAPYQTPGVENAPHPGRTSLGVRTEHFDLTRPEGGKQATVTHKKRRKIDPESMRQRAFGLHDYAQSTGAKRSIRETIGDAIASAFNRDSARTFNFWERTVGTQYGKARKDAHFRRVYDAAHAFIDDASRFANEAADKARDILPHMDGLKDIAAGLDMAKAWRDSKDYEAVSSAIFDGTLEGEAFDDATLESRFGLTGKQRQVYRQFREAVDFSLQTLASSEMARAARAAKMEIADQGMSMAEAVAFYTGQLDPMIEEAKAALHEKAGDLVNRHMEERNAIDDMASSGEYSDAALQSMREAMSARHMAENDESVRLLRELQDLRDSFTDKAGQINKLSSEGYAPLMRYGQYVVDVVRLNDDGSVAMAEDGEPDRPFFGMFESESEAKEAAKALAEEYPEYTVSRGVMSQLANQQFKGVTPEVAEMFARLLGTDEKHAFQAYLKQAVANRSAMKRLIHRKGMKGFSQDVPRVLASFITSNSRLASGNWHFGDMSEAIADIPKSKGDVSDEAIKLAQYIQNPQEEAAALRGFMFFNFLGGSVASAMVNLTQTASTTYPFLAQYGAKKAAAAIGKAMTRSARVMKDGGFDAIVDEQLREALVKASEEGIIDPQEIHLLMAESSGTDGLTGAAAKLAGKISKGAEVPVTRVGRAFMQAWGAMFGAAEKYNRHVAFMAAWDVAPEGVNRYEFAKDAVVATQFDYCVDTETEILTAQGWRRFDQILPGDAVFSVNENGELAEDALKAVHVFGGPRKVTEFRNANGLSIVVTDGHRNMIQIYISRDRKWQKLRAVKTADLKGCHNFLRVPLGDATGREAIYSDDQVRLLAWVASEGWFARLRGSVEKRQVRIGQSNTHNPEYVAEIDDLLNRLGGHFSKYRYDRKQGDSLTTFVLRKPLWEFIGKALPEKRITMDLVSKLPPAQMRIFLETFAKGDGTFLKEGGVAIGQKSVESLNVLQAMAVLSGQSSTMWERHKNGATGELKDYGTVYVCKQSLRAQVSSMKRIEREVDAVWCPETENGTWIARRNGRTFITGNSKASRSNWGRGPVGATLFTFRTFMISYIEFLGRLPSRERAIAVAVLLLMAGASGLPGIDDFEDVMDTIGQKFGYNWNSAAMRHSWLVKTLGVDGANLFEHGLSSILPLDVSARLGMGNMIPMTGLFKKSNEDKGREAAEVFGAPGAFAKNIVESIDRIGSGRPLMETVLPALPKAMTDAYKAIDMLQTGAYRDGRGRKVVDVTAADAFIKAIGFQPNRVAEPRRVEWMLAQSSAMYRTARTEIHDLWARGVAENDPDKIASARAALLDWNKKNPKERITINPASIKGRVRAMRLTSADRLVKATPKDMRGMLAAELETTR